MGADAARHYEFFPFASPGHCALHPPVESAFQDTLAGYYWESLQKMLARAVQYPYHIVVPFICCSNKLVVSFVTHGLLYQKFTDAFKFHQLTLEHRDCTLGRNLSGSMLLLEYLMKAAIRRSLHTAFLLQKPNARLPAA